MVALETKKFVLHSITIENDQEQVISEFNHIEDFDDYMIDLNMELSQDDNDGDYPQDYLDHIHVFYNVMLNDNEIYGLNKIEYKKLLGD